MRSCTLFSVGLLAFCVSTASGSARADDFTRFGPYLGIDGVWMQPLFEDSLRSTSGVAAKVDGSFGLNARAGLRLLGFLAIEGQYEWLDGFDMQLAGGDIGTLSAHVLTGNAKLYIPIWRVQPYLLAGLGGSWHRFQGVGIASGVDVSDSAFAGRVGGGVDLYLTRSLVLNAEATALLTTQDLSAGATALDKLHYLSFGVGLQYRF